MKPHVATACCVAMLLVSGCNMVTIREPIGSVAPGADLKALEGSWLVDEGEIAEVRLAKSGKLLVGFVEWDKDAEEFHAHTLEAVATKFGDLSLLHLKSDDKSPDDGYAFCHYEIDGDTARLYFPDTDVFQEAVASGRLAGSIKVQPYSTKVRLDSTGETLEAFIAENSKNDCFKHEPSTTFKRLHRPE